MKVIHRRHALRQRYLPSGVREWGLACGPRPLCKDLSWPAQCMFPTHDSPVQPKGDDLFPTALKCFIPEFSLH